MSQRPDPDRASASPTVVGGRADAAGDIGDPDAGLTSALAVWRQAETPAAAEAVYAALLVARVFAPLTARLEAADVDQDTGLVAEKSSAMDLVTPVSANGTTAVAVFTSAAAMGRWRDDVRPVPVPGRDACAVAVTDGHAALVIDLGTTGFVLEGAALQALAHGRLPAPTAAVPRLINGARIAPPRPPAGVAARLAAVLAAEPEIKAAYLFDVLADDAPPTLTAGLALAGSPDPLALQAMATRLAGQLGEELAYRTDLDVTVLAGADQEVVRAVVPPIYALDVAVEDADDIAGST